MKLFIQLAFACAVGLFGCGSQHSKAPLASAPETRQRPALSVQVTPAEAGAHTPVRVF